MMTKKIYIVILAIQFLLLACGQKEDKTTSNIIHLPSGFTLQKDTILVNVNGEMTHALKFQNKHYVLFQQQFLKYGSSGKRWLYIFSNGKVEKFFECPKELQTPYIDFYVKNDSLIIKPYMDGQSYLFNHKNDKWNKISYTDDLIFEDENFYIYSLDFGEWGGKTWFKDKKTNLEYAVDATTPLVNKIGTAYYLSNSFKVVKIKNPLELSRCENDFTYENVKENHNYYTWEIKPLGIENVYKDSIFDFLDTEYRPYIVSSFVFKNELVHLYETDSVTYLARIKNNKIEPFEKIENNMSFFNWHYSNRCKNVKGTNELVKFKNEKKNSEGILEIIDTKIIITYFINQAELKPKVIGVKASNELFLKRVDLVVTQFDKLTFNNIEGKEKEWGSFDVSPTHIIRPADSRNTKNHTIDICKSYITDEDHLISQSILYFGTKENDLVRTVSIKWEEINANNHIKDQSIKKTFINRHKELESILSQKFGKPIEKKKEKDKYPSTVWRFKNDIYIELFNAISNEYNYNSIGVAIYKK